MKKVILAVISVAFVAVAAQAQSPRVEVILTSGALNGKAAKPNRPTTSQQRNDTLERMVLQQVEQAKRPAQHASVKPARPSRPVATAQKTQGGNVGQWLKAIFLGGRFPGESAQAYHDRLVSQSQPASLPFK